MDDRIFLKYAWRGLGNAVLAVFGTFLVIYRMSLKIVRWTQYSGSQGSVVQITRPNFTLPNLRTDFQVHACNHSSVMLGWFIGLHIVQWYFCRWNVMRWDGRSSYSYARWSELLKDLASLLRSRWDCFLPMYSCLYQETSLVISVISLPGRCYLNERTKCKVKFIVMK